LLLTSFSDAIQENPLSQHNLFSAYFSPCSLLSEESERDEGWNLREVRPVLTPREFDNLTAELFFFPFLLLFPNIFSRLLFGLVIFHFFFFFFF